MVCLNKKLIWLKYEFIFLPPTEMIKLKFGFGLDAGVLCEETFNAELNRITY